MKPSDEQKFSPYLNDREEVRELTVQSIVLGAMIAAGMCAAMLYLGLRIGMTICASIPAAVISMGILRGILRRGTILENNIVQTIGSAGESLAAGALFTMPALILAGIWTEFDYWTVTMVALLGGFLGVFFMIPLRRSLIIEEKELTYPEGVACAEVLKAGQKRGIGVTLLVVGGVLGATAKLLISLVASIAEKAVVLIKLSKGIFTAFAIDFSLAAFGVGYIVGFNISALVLLGGAIAWFIAIPIYLSCHPELAEPQTFKHLKSVYGTVRYLGVGAMVVGGIWSIVRMRSGIIRALKSLSKRISSSSPQALKTIERTEQDMPFHSIIIFGILSVIGIFLLYSFVLEGYSASVTATVAMFVTGFFFVAVSSYITGLVGSSNNPVSGMTICTILFTFALLYLFGVSGATGIFALLVVAGVVCCAAATAGDVSQDLKTGYIVGATPKKQQIGQIIGVAASAFIIAPVLGVLHSTYRIGSDDMPAPQAGMFHSLSEGLMKKGSEIPWNLVLIGAIMAVGIGIIDEILRKKKSSFRLHIMPLAVGLYLPLYLGVIIFTGGIVSLFQTILIRKKDERKRAQLKQYGVLVASGLVAGEALAGIAIAVIRTAQEAMKEKVVEKAVKPEIVEYWYPAAGLLILAAILLLIFSVRGLKGRE